MPRIENEELIRVHLWLYASDVERIHLMFDRTLGFSKAARTIIRKFFKELDNRTAAGAKTVPSGAEAGELDLPD